MDRATLFRVWFVGVVLVVVQGSVVHAARNHDELQQYFPTLLHNTPVLAEPAFAAYLGLAVVGVNEEAELYTLRADASGAERLTHNSVHERSLESPEGDLYTPYKNQLMVMNRDGSHATALGEMQISSRKGKFSMHALPRWTVLGSLVITLLLGGSWGLTLPSNAQGGATTRVSVASEGTEGNRGSYRPGLFGDRRYGVFASWAKTLIAPDTNDAVDVFGKDHLTGRTSLVSVTPDQKQGNHSASLLSISADGRYLPFQPEATPLVENDPNSQPDVFGRERGLLHAVFVPLILSSDTLNLPCGNQDSEPNNRFSEAVAHPVLCPDTQLTGSANRKIDLVDFFRVKVEQAATLQIDLTNLPPNSDFDLYLYNETGVPQGVGNQSGSHNEQIRVSATPGRYFIGVYAILDDPNSTTYDLRWVAE